MARARGPQMQLGMALRSVPVPAPKEFKKCKRCLMDLPVESFSPNKLGRNGRQAKCRSCCNEMYGSKTGRKRHNPQTCHDCTVNSLRFCGRCKTHKSRSDFEKDKSGLHWLSTRCVPCAKEHRQKVKPAMTKISARCISCGVIFMCAGAHRKTCAAPECKREYYRIVARRRAMAETYKITEDDYWRMHREQDGKCAICRSDDPRHPATKETRRLCIDHDHVTGNVRGLLCSPCNMGIGHFSDDTDRMSAAIRYLLRTRSTT